MSYPFLRPLGLPPVSQAVVCRERLPNPTLLSPDRDPLILQLPLKSSIFLGNNTTAQDETKRNFRSYDPRQVLTLVKKGRSCRRELTGASHNTIIAY